MTTTNKEPETTAPAFDPAAYIAGQPWRLCAAVPDHEYLTPQASTDPEAHTAPLQWIASSPERDTCRAKHWPVRWLDGWKLWIGPWSLANRRQLAPGETEPPVQGQLWWPPARPLIRR